MGGNIKKKKNEATTTGSTCTSSRSPTWGRWSRRSGHHGRIKVLAEQDGVRNTAVGASAHARDLSRKVASPVSRRSHLNDVSGMMYRKKKNSFFFFPRTDAGSIFFSFRTSSKESRLFILDEFLFSSDLYERSKSKLGYFISIGYYCCQIQNKVT